jgi:hypothetical protein
MIDPQEEEEEEEEDAHKAAFEIMCAIVEARRDCAMSAFSGATISTSFPSLHVFAVSHIRALSLQHLSALRTK